MKYIVYITTNTVNNKIYVGVHKCNDVNSFDGYIGCGIRSETQKLLDYPFHRAVKKYGYKSFRRHTLAVFNNAEDAYHLEREIVTEAFIQSKNNYNVAPGGICSAGTVNKSKILQYTLSGKFVKEWDSITEASNHFKCSPGTLRQALSAPFKSRAGYQWRYYTPEFPIHIGYYNSTKRVAQYGVDGHLVKVWSSCKAAATSLGKKSDSAINRYAKAHKLYEGYQWRVIRNNTAVPDIIEEYKDKSIILQISLNGSVIKEWNKQELYKTAQFKNVKDCINGKTKTYKGFIWKPKYETI